MARYLTGGIYTTSAWRTLGSRLLEAFYPTGSFRYDFGFGKKDVRDSCKDHLDYETKLAFKQIIMGHDLKGPDNLETMRRIMAWTNKTYPSGKYYVRDKRERWNPALETLQIWQRKAAGLARPNESTDCDDYANFIYTLARVAGVPSEVLYKAYMKTITEWHMNVMFFHEGVPYAIEGTYYPQEAQRVLGKISYYENRIWTGSQREYYYDFVRWIFNEDVVRINTHAIKEA